MRPEIQLEAVAQDLRIDLADPALPRRAGIRDDDIDAAEPLGDPVEGLAHRVGIGHVGGDADPAELLRGLLDPGTGAVDQRDLGPGAFQRPRRREADRAGAAGDQRDLAGERLFDRAAELGLFERPVFHLEQFGLGQRLEPADRFGVGHGRDPAFGEIGGDRGVLGAAPETEQAEPRHQDDARRRVEFLRFDRSGGVVAREIGAVVGHEALDGVARRGGKAVEPAGLGRRHDAAGSSWCGSCGRGWRPRPARSAAARRR